MVVGVLVGGVLVGGVLVGGVLVEGVLVEGSGSLFAGSEVTVSETGSSEMSVSDEVTSEVSVSDEVMSEVSVSEFSEVLKGLSIPPISPVFSVLPQAQNDSITANIVKMAKSFFIKNSPLKVIYTPLLMRCRAKIGIF